MNHHWRPAILIVLGLVLGSSAKADVRLPHVFGDHMVLQRNKPLKFWGWADKNERVTVELAGHKASDRANAFGEWAVTLPSMKAGGPHAITIKGNNTLTVSDVLVGEVWIGSGQSNMQWNVAASANGAREIAEAKFPKLRLFLVPNVLSGVPNRDVNANWQQCSPASVPSFSAVLYFFGRHLHRELDIPVGLIASAWGGSRIEPWTPPVGFAGVKRLSGISENIRQVQGDYLRDLEKQVLELPSPRSDLVDWIKLATRAAKRDEVLPAAPAFNYPPHPLAGWPVETSMYNAMIHPVVPFSVRGVIWYQGESNLGEGMLYYHKMKALIEGWRKAWGTRELSFYWAQLAPFNYGGDPHRLPRIWEAQQMATAIPRSGMAVITDIANLGDIHPRNKQDVGKRLALWALAKDYRRDIVYSGPVFRSMKIEGSRVRVFFDHVGSGLESRDGQPLARFEIAGDGEFVPAEAVIDGETVVVSSENVDQPTAVRFGWHQLAEPNLQNREGLQACAFRTTSTTPTIAGKKLFVKDTSVVLDCLETSGVIRYTLDGSLPTAKSRRYKSPLRLDDTTSVRARFFRDGGKISAVTQATFTRVKPRKYKDKTLVPGLRYEYYEGQWNAVPDFEKLKAVTSGLVDDFTLAPRRRNDNFGFRFTGYVEITKPGRYTFQTESDDGSKLYVDGEQVVNNDGIHPVVRKSGAVELKPGMHRVVVTFFELAGGEVLTVKFAGPGVPLSAMTLWCEEK